MLSNGMSLSVVYAFVLLNALDFKARNLEITSVFQRKCNTLIM